MTLPAWIVIAGLFAAFVYFVLLPLISEQPRHAPKHKRPSGDLLRDEADDDERFDEPLNVETPAELTRLNEGDAR